MEVWILKEFNSRNLYKKCWLKKLVYRAALANWYLDWDVKFYFHHQFLKFNKQSSISFYRNKCLINDWSRSIFRKFKMSRHQGKAYASLGLICGVRKASF